MSYDLYVGMQYAPFCARVGLDDMAPRKPLATANAVYALAASARYIALGVSNNPYLQVFKDGELIDVTTPILPSRTQSCCMVFSPDGRRLYCGLYNTPFLAVINTETWSLLSGLPAIPIAPSQLALSHDGSKLMICHNDTRQPVLLDTQTLAAINTGNVFGQYSYGAAFNHDDSILYVSSNNPRLLRAIRVSDWTVIASVATPGNGRVFYNGDHVLWQQAYGQDHLLLDAQLNPLPLEITRQTQAITAVPGGFVITYADNAYPRVELMRTPDGTRETIDGMAYVFGQIYDLAVTQPVFKRIYGTVRDRDGNPAQRTVRVFRRADGRQVAEAQSDAASGDYEIAVVDDEYDVVAQAADGEKLNDLIYARVTPE